MRLRGALLSALLFWPALASSQQDDHDWATDPRLLAILERVELNSVPNVDGQALLIRQVLEQPETQREVMVRGIYWSVLLADASIVNSTDDLTQTMVIASEGCLLPSPICEFIKKQMLPHQIQNRFTVGFSVLGQAVTHFAEKGDCVRERKGVIDSVSFVWGSTGFALASTSNAEHAPCFIQRLKV